MRKEGNNFLRKAKENKKDEFYTQYKDIENELNYYKNHFKNKTVFCNCDNPISSNFFKYFVNNFNELGLNKVIAACYFQNEYNIFDFENKFNKGYYYEYTGCDNEIKNPNINNVVFFQGDGDFRNVESIELLKKSDIIVTNPPFSLFREFITQLIEYEKKFLIIGNINAITYKTVFNLIQENKIWLGVNYGRGISGFIVPDNYELYGTEFRIDKNGNKIISPNNCLWLTNLDNYKRHENIKLKMKYIGNESKYPKYDNYDGININKTNEIPYDYEGSMGVPITFLHKFNPEQFKIIKFRKGNDEKDLRVNGKTPYFRILIKNKKVVNEI